VRGHDFLAHAGQWKSQASETGQLEATQPLLDELLQLRRFVDDKEPKASSRFPLQGIRLTFGPAPGAFFLGYEKLYRWARLPDGLEARVQDAVQQQDKIYDVALNATGGWVLLLREGKKYVWGGDLPDRLQEALEQGQREKATISVCTSPSELQSISRVATFTDNGCHDTQRLYLNHQNSSEYVLLFKKGRSCVSLHSDFEQPLKRLVERVTEKLDWDFTPSCACEKREQQCSNAAYYNSRGRFQLCRKEPALALAYLKEGCRLDKGNVEYRDDYAMALVAHRLLVKDEILECCITSGNWAQIIDDEDDMDGDNDNDNAKRFRADYRKKVHNAGEYERLKARLQDIVAAAHAARCVGGCPPLHWSYAAGAAAAAAAAAANGGVRHELPLHPLVQVVSELPADAVERSESAGERSVPTAAVARTSSVATAPSRLERKRYTRLLLEVWK
jgi:hypothetical protein